MAAADWFARAEAVEPAPARPRTTRRPVQRPVQRPAAPVRSRRRATQRRVRGHIVWMILFALLLFGVVFLNVAVLRAHVAVTHLDQKRTQLQNENEALASQLSAASSAPKIEGAARKLGLVQASAAATSYLDLAPHRR
jgi:cell division protein FtsL